ncbi:OLC1v1016990C1 [Oldenlandia corymbosa var. corymbosa]|uniref:OLC1v1016990C1 n=1 Tax=Oldenlandia corymbosa var. corymbosa TaxID=529605 RepID=A0AAV1E8E5_OLDCO|nr:OLC1v1016990C1 [Oldenlandia corymbosa var. corymbosa]
MDPEIWSRLPEEILEHVLSFLPLKTFLTLRTTSKHFQSLLFSPAFVSKYSASSTPLFSFLVLSHPQFGSKCPLFDTGRNSWRTLPLHFSPILKNTSAPSSSVLISISNGRLCFSHTNSSSFVVRNLFPPSIDVVKSPKKIPSSYESLSFVSTSSGYNLLMMTSFGSSKTALVYDSKIHTWKQFQGFGQSLYNQEGVLYQGLLYFITPEPFQIVCFDLESGIWGRSVIELPGELAFAKMLASNDRGNEKLYLIGGIGGNGISRSMKLWELSGEKNWVEIERLPEMMFRKFVGVCYHKYEHVYCFWHQGLICICCYTWPEILYFKVSRRSWHWLPKCPLLPEKWSCGFKWFSFAPQLCSSA